jgi:gluconolactonase
MIMRAFLVFSALLPLAATGCGDEGSAGAGGGASSAETSATGTGGAGAEAGVTSSSSGGGGAATGAGGGGGGGAHREICPGGPYAAAPLPTNGTATRLQGGFNFLEGPVWFAELGALFFSDMNFGAPNPTPLNGPQSRIHKFTPPSTFEVFIDNASSNGLGISPGGDLIACTHDTRSVSLIDLATKARTQVADRYMNGRFNSPNDVVVRRDGNIYFSDPDWQLSQESELPMAVYRVSPSGEVHVVDRLDKPNGVALSPDEGTLYVGAIDGKIRKYIVGEDGSTGPASDFARVSGPDGMGVDCAGNLYVSGSAGVDVLAPDGTQLGTINGVTSATNVAFGGPERKTLFITGGNSLYSIELNIPGYPY